MRLSALFKNLLSFLAGLALFLLILEGGLRLGGYLFLSLQELRNEAALRQKNTVKILCLGESTTALGGRNSFPAQLERILNQNNPDKKFSVINKGIPTIRSYEILLQLDRQLDRYRPDIVVTMMGINDGWDLTSDEVVYVGRRNFLGTLRIVKLARWLRQILTSPDDKSAGQYSPFAMARDDDMMDILNNKEKALKGALKTNPDNDALHLALGACYANQGKYRKSEQVLQKTLSINPGNANAYIELGLILQHQGKYKKSEAAYKKAIDLLPHYWPTYTLLSATYRMQRKWAEAENFLKKTIGRFPEIHWFYFELGVCYKWQKQHEQAEALFLKAIELDTNKEHAWPYIELGRYYKNLGQKEKAEEMFTEAISIDTNSPWAYFEMGIPYQTERRLELGGPATVYNYQKIAEKILNRGIKMVSVQYPMRSIQPLNDMLEPFQEKIIFVDNEKRFKKAVLEKGYNVYFSDRFAGDFGHCTPKGNKLLAESIAEAILKNMLP